jgi:hypothetical protein
MFVHCHYSSAPGVDLDLNFRQHGVVRQLWPFTGADIVWPPIRPITWAEANELARTFSDLKRHPNIVWVP